MAKGKGKGKGKGKKEKVEPDPNALTEVDKTFYELQITDLNRKLARLRTLSKELEEKNEALIEESKKLEEDRGDIIMFLKRTLQEKADEMQELQERMSATEESRQEETEEFEEKIKEMEQEYRQMHETLSSELKLVAGKLNSLEEFRVQRDELMRKFEDQEKGMDEQEMRHKREIYEIERKFIIGKDKLKKEMEARLLQLSTEFQDATEVRIASTTHRVIRENIAINNELELMLQTHHRLTEENDKLKARDRSLRLEAEIHDAEKKKAVFKAGVQYKLIDKINDEYDRLSKQIAKYKSSEKHIIKLEREMGITKKATLNLNYTIRILEQNLHNSRCDRTRLQTELEYLRDEVSRLSDILFNAALSIQDALDVKQEISSESLLDESFIMSKRESLLDNLLALMTKATEERPRKPSLDSVDSMTATYTRGDLGFVPKTVELRSKMPTKQHKEVEVGPSFEDFLEASKPQPVEQTGDSELQMALLSDPNLLRDYLRDLQKEVVGMGEEESEMSMTLFDGMDEESVESEGAVNPLDLDMAAIMAVDTSQMEDKDNEGGTRSKSRPKVHMESEKAEAKRLALEDAEESLKREQSIRLAVSKSVLRQKSLGHVGIDEESVDVSKSVSHSAVTSKSAALLSAAASKSAAILSSAASRAAISEIVEASKSGTLKTVLASKSAISQTAVAIKSGPSQVDVAIKSGPSQADVAIKSGPSQADVAIKSGPSHTAVASKSRTSQTAVASKSAVLETKASPSAVAAASNAAVAEESAPPENAEGDAAPPTEA